MNTISFIAKIKLNQVKSQHLLLIAYPALAIVLLHDYLILTSINFLLGVLALCVGLSTAKKQKFSIRYGCVLLLSLLLTYMMPVKTFLYFSVGFAFLFFIEWTIGKQSLLFPLTIVLMSPIFQYLVNTFSFPIRIMMTGWVGGLFNLVGESTQIAGNMIVQQGNEFSVDPACMGIQMMEASLMLGVLLLFFYQHTLNKKNHTGKTIVFLTAIVILNILCNLLRIVFLVKFKILPGTAGHEIAGIVALLIYVFLPATWLARKLVNCSPANLSNSLQHSVKINRLMIHVFAFVVIAVLGFRVAKTDTFSAFNKVPVGKNGEYTVTVYAPGILKLQTKQSLIYLKYTRGFFDSDHNPLLCWTGSGYQFKYIRKTQLAGVEMYRAEIIKGDEKLYTAWWFDNGTKQTISPIEWRWDRLCGGKNYAVVNITCADPGVLDRELERVLTKHSLQSLINISE